MMIVLLVQLFDKLKSITIKHHFSLLRICLIGDKLLMSGNYSCSPNSTFLSDLYNASELALLREIPGIPGIASGIFAGYLSN